MCGLHLAGWVRLKMFLREVGGVESGEGEERESLGGPC